ncbi:MAG: glycosyltransferase family 4 protein [Microthrixaceae bacterium]
MNSPTILLAVNAFPSMSETFIERKVSTLVSQGFDVVVGASSFGDGATRTGARLMPLTPWRHPVDSTRRLRTMGVGTAARVLASASGGRSKAAVLAAPLTAVRADLIHFEYSGIAVAYRAVLDRLRPARVVVSCRGSAELIRPVVEPSRRAALVDTLRAADSIHCVSQHMAEHLRRMGVTPGKVFVNRPAVDVDTFARLHRATPRDTTQPLRILSVGRLHWCKALDDALAAVALTTAAGVPLRYRIVGAGPERERLAFLISQLGLADSVELVGPLPADAVRAELANTDVVLLTSLSEGISNSAVEAMSAGVPVVSTRAGGMAEAVIDGQTGLLAEIGDVAGISRCLVELASDEERRGRLGRNAMEAMTAEFDLSRQVRVFADEYRRLLESPAHRTSTGPNRATAP